MRGNEELSRWGGKALEGAAAVIVGSEHIRDVLIEICGTVERVHTIPPGVDVELWQPQARETALEALVAEARRDPPNPGNADERHPDEGNAERLAAFLAGDRPTVVYFGKLIRNKGVQVLFEALRGIDARTVIVGFGDYRAELEQLAEGLDVLFTGPLGTRHLVHLLALADVSAVPSIFPEAFGMVAAESAAAGCPPVVADHSGLASVADGLEESYRRAARARAVPERGRGRAARAARGDPRARSRRPCRDPRGRARHRGRALELAKHRTADRRDRLSGASRACATVSAAERARRGCPTGRRARSARRPDRDDVAAEPHAGSAQALHLGGDVVDDEVDAVPASGTRPGPVRHRPPCRAGRAAEQQPQLPADDVGEGRRLDSTDSEAEVGRVEVDRSVDVVDEVADIDRVIVHAHATSLRTDPEAIAAAPAGCATQRQWADSPLRQIDGGRIRMSAVPAEAPRSFDHLREQSIGLPQVLFQSITHMAPAAAIAFSILFSVPFAGPALPLSVLLALIACLLVAISIGQLAKKMPSAGGLYAYVPRRSARPGVPRRVALPLLRAARSPAPLPDLRVGDDRRVPDGRRLGLDGPVVDLGLVAAAVVVLPDLPRRPAVDGRGSDPRHLRDRRLRRAGDLDAAVERLRLNAAAVQPAQRGPATCNGIFKGMVFAILAFIGFEAAAPLGEEAKRPATDRPARRRRLCHR